MHEVAGKTALRDMRRMDAYDMLRTLERGRSDYSAVFDENRVAITGGHFQNPLVDNEKNASVLNILNTLRICVMHDPSFDQGERGFSTQASI